MSTFQINTMDDIYQFVERLQVECRKAGKTELWGQLDDALHLGSSGMEILGAIRMAVLNNEAVIHQLLGSAGKNEGKMVVAFVDKAFGRTA